MRCYFMRKGRIAAAEQLEPGSDESLIAQGRHCSSSDQTNSMTASRFGPEPANSTPIPVSTPIL